MKTTSLILKILVSEYSKSQLIDLKVKIFRGDTNYLEVFADGQVLLPPNNNPTVWDSVIKNPGAGNVDLLAQAIEQGHKRGLKVYGSSKL